MSKSMSRCKPCSSVIALAALTAALIIPGVASAAPPSDDWGWAAVRKPGLAAYEVKGKDRRNRTGDVVKVKRLARGRHRVIFRGQTSESGNVQVTPLTSKPGICTVESWEPQNGNVQVFVDCFGRGGRSKDVPFMVSFLDSTASGGRMGFLWADEPTSASYTPDLSYQFNSTFSPNTVTRSGTGTYEVTLPGIGVDAGNVQVTAYGSTAVVCRSVSWGDRGSGALSTEVDCRDRKGNLVDSRYLLLFVAGEGMKGDGGSSWAYLWADRPAKASYVPDASYRDADPAGKPRITRTGKGDYTVKLPSMPLGGIAHVTSYGSSKARCHTDAVRKTGTPQRIGVRCFKSGGSTTADAKFSLSFEK